MLRSTLMATLVLTAACGQPSSLAKLDVSLKIPKKPGEAYSLVRSASREDQIVSIAVSDNYLFFSTSWKGVYRLPKYGGTIDPVEEDADAVATVAADRDTVFWNHTTFGSGDVPHTQLKKRAAAGGVSSILLDGDFSLPGIGGSSSLSATSNALYVTTQNNGGSAPIEFKRLALSSGTTTTLLSVPYSHTSFPFELPQTWLVKDDHLYYSKRDVGTGITKLLQAKSDGSGAIEIVAGTSIGGSYLGADASSLYTSGKVGTYQGMVAVARADGALTALDKSAGSALASVTSTFAVDGANLYFMTIDPAVGWQVQALPKAGGTPTVIGSGAQFDLGINQMEQDDDNLYLLHGWHEILLLPKKPVAAKAL